MGSGDGKPAVVREQGSPNGKGLTTVLGVPVGSLIEKLTVV